MVSSSVFADNPNAWPPKNSDERQLFKYQANNLGLQNKYQRQKGITGPIQHPTLDMKWMEIIRWKIPARRSVLWESGNYLFLHLVCYLKVNIYFLPNKLYGS